MMMHFLNKQVTRLLVVLALVLSAARAPAANFSFTGAFNRDDNVQQIGFTLSSAGNVTLRTFGYGGGTNSAGAIIPGGGFDTLLSLYNATTGALIGFNDDGASPPLVTNPVTGFVGDSLLTSSLAAGSYLVALTEYDNVPNGNLSSGFFESGKGNFTPGLTGCPAPAFCAFSLNPPGYSLRTGNWALDILGVTSIGVSQTPEPPTVLLLGVGLSGIALIRKRKIFKNNDFAIRFPYPRT